LLVRQTTDYHYKEKLIAQLLERIVVVPNFRHGNDFVLVGVESDHIDVMRLDLLFGGLHRSLLASVRAPKRCEKHHRSEHEAVKPMQSTNTTIQPEKGVNKHKNSLPIMQEPVFLVDGDIVQLVAGIRSNSRAQIRHPVSIGLKKEGKKERKVRREKKKKKKKKKKKSTKTSPPQAKP
jgi:hypothetical protein